MNTINIAVPHFNQSRFLSKALDSIIDDNGADKFQVDIIVVDDGSEAKEAEAAMKIVLARKQNLPPNTKLMWMSQTPNKGSAFTITTGHGLLGDSEWMTWCSSDNTYRPGWLGDLLGLVDDMTGVVYGDYTWTKPGIRTFEVGVDYDPDYLIKHPRNCYIGPAFIVRSDVWTAAGDHEGWNAHDYGHWLRVEEVCWRMNLDILRVDHSLCVYLAHSERATERRKGDKWEDAMDHQRAAVKRREG